LLTLRRDLAIAPFDEALRALDEAGSYRDLATALQKAGEASAVEALVEVLSAARPSPFAEGAPRQRRSMRCWSFAECASDVGAGRASVCELPAEKRSALLEALRRGDAFCGSLKRSMGKAGSASLMKLGRSRTMWLLGASPDDPHTLEAVAKPQAAGQGRKRRRRGSRRGQETADVVMSGSEAESEDPMDSDLEEDKAAPQEKATPQASAKKKQSATMAFLEELRKKRKLGPSKAAGEEASKH